MLRLLDFLGCQAFPRERSTRCSVGWCTGSRMTPQSVLRWRRRVGRGREKSDWACTIPTCLLCFTSLSLGQGFRAEELSAAARCWHKASQPALACAVGLRTGAAWCGRAAALCSQSAEEPAWKYAVVQRRVKTFRFICFGRLGLQAAAADTGGAAQGIQQ